MKEYLNLKDPWRILNPDKSHYRWRLKNVTKQSGLDYYLVSDDILAMTNQCDIGISYKSDHSVTSLEMSLNPIKRGRRYR